MEREPGRSDSLHESVRRLMRWRYLVVAGVSVAAWVAIGSTSALAADPGHVHQSNSNVSTTAVDNNDGQSTGLLTGPIVTPVTLGVQGNSTGPININLMGSQSGSGSGGAGADQSNVNSSTTVVNNRGAQSAGPVAGPIVAPVTLAAQDSASHPVDTNVNSSQADSGNASPGDVSQLNDNSSTTVVDNGGAQSAGAIAGPVVAPVTLGVQTNSQGPIDANGGSDQAFSGNGADGDVRQTNVNGSTTVLRNEGAQSAGQVAGPIVLPVTGQVGTNSSGPVDTNVLSSQFDSGSGQAGAVTQANANQSVTLVDNRDAQCAASTLAGPIVAPMTSQVGNSIEGPVVTNAGSSQVDSGNDDAGAVSQGNTNGSLTMVDNRDAQSVAGIGMAGPVVAPLTPQVGTNMSGPANTNLMSSQVESGNGNAGDVSQVNDNGSLTLVDNRGAQSAGGWAGPVVTPVTPQVGTNGSGPFNLNASSNQAASGSGNIGQVGQANLDSSFTGVDNRGAWSAGSIVGAVLLVAPVTPQVGTNDNGPMNGQLFSNQRDSGSGAGVEQVNANNSVATLDNRAARSAGSAGGAIVAPVSPQVGTNSSGAANVNADSNQDASGNAGAGAVRQLNWNSTWANVDSAGTRSVGGVVVAPVTPQVGTNLNGPDNVNLMSNQADSGSGNAGEVRQLNWNASSAWAGSRGTRSAAIGAAGIAVIPVSPQVGSNVNGAVNGNVASSQWDSGNASPGDLWQGNSSQAWTWVDSAGAQAAGPLAGAFVAPVSPQVGTNLDGVSNGSACASQIGSGNAGTGGVHQLNWAGSWTWLDNSGARSAGAVAGPVVAPVTPQVGTNVAGPVDVNEGAGQVVSGSAGAGGVNQLNWNGSWTWLDNTGARSAGAVAGPVVAPVTPQAATNVAGPVNVNAGAGQVVSGSGGAGGVQQLNWNGSMTWAGSTCGMSAAQLLGPIVAPVTIQTGTNDDGPVNVNLFSSQLDSGNGAGGDLWQDNANGASDMLTGTPAMAPVTSAVNSNMAGPMNANGGGIQRTSGEAGPAGLDMMTAAFHNAAAVSDSGGPIGLIVAAVAVLVAMGSLLTTRRRGER